MQLGLRLGIEDAPQTWIVTAEYISTGGWVCSWNCDGGGDEGVQGLHNPKLWLGGQSKRKEWDSTYQFGFITYHSIWCILQ